MEPNKLDKPDKKPVGPGSIFLKALLVALLVPTLALAGCSGLGQGETQGNGQSEDQKDGGTTTSVTTAARTSTSLEGTGVSGEKETTGIQTESPTVAPDLASIDNFRPGPVDNNGDPRTYVDYAFNQATYLTGSNRTGLALVPVGGGDSVYGSDFIPAKSVDEEGDNEVTVLFDGDLSPSDFARGFVSDNAVSSDSQGNAPLNVGQARTITPEATSVNPELVSVRLDCQQDQVIFDFDEPLDQEDVVQNTGGLRVYFKDTKNAGAQAVNEADDPTVLKGAFPDLPQGKTLSDAVGGYVTNGAVAGKSPNGPEGQAINQFDERHPLERGDGCP